MYSYLKTARPISRVLYPHGRLSLISKRALLRLSLALYPPTQASSLQTSVYMSLQPTVCSFHPRYPETRLYGGDQTLLPAGR